MRFASAIIAVLVLAASLSFLLLPADGEERTRAGSEAYLIGPFSDVTTVMEDGTYSSNYFAVMGDLSQYSLKTSPDWLSIGTGSPLILNTTGLEARWTFDQRNADDSSGNGHHGTIHGAVANTGVFSIGSSMLFDGDDYITVPHDDRLNITDEITLEAWIYPTFTDSGEHMIISKGGHWGDDDPQDYELTMDRDRPLFQIKIPGSNDWYGAAPMDPISKNTWHHVAGVYDGNIFMIYIDGKNQTSLFNGWSGDYMGHVYTGGLPTSSDNISIGRRAPASWGSLFYEGRIDEVRIFDRALEGGEILEHATRPGTSTVILTGNPDNGDVGDHQVTVNITNGNGFYAERDFTLTVLNVDPVILTEDMTGAVQDQEYSVSYDADDEGQGTTYWSLDTEASFLSMDTATGLLSGIPGNDDVGDHDVRVIFSDGKGGLDLHDFVLTVADVNDPPSITTLTIPNATEDETYEIQLEGTDIDGEILNWTFEMDADWLTETDGGLLSGTPGNDDVGNYTITARATDPRGLFVDEIYEITVFNVNDDPEWIDVPYHVSIKEGETFIFDVNATDVDSGDEVSYSVMTSHETDLTMDENGVITWIASRIPFESTPYNLTVKVDISDGKVTLSHFFYIDVIPNTPAETELHFPVDGSILNTKYTNLTWIANDPDGGDLQYKVYISDTRSDVTSLDEKVMMEADGRNLPIPDLEPGTTYYWTVIPWDGFSNGTCLNETFSFYVNTPPGTDLNLPGVGSLFSSSGVTLSWNGFDIEGDDVTYSVYIGEDESLVENLDGMVRKIPGIEDEELVLTDLEPGKTYYWTVVPDDGLNTGICNSGIWNFITNPLPEVESVEDVTSSGTDRISVDINATDDQGVSFSLVDPVEGMFINEDTGVFIWIPEEGVTGTFNVTVKISDGMDDVFVEFTITVTEKEGKVGEEEGGISIMIIVVIIIIIVILLLIVIVIMVLLRKRKGEGTGETDNENMTVGNEIPDTGMEQPVGSDPVSGPLTVEVQNPVSIPQESQQHQVEQQQPPIETQIPSQPEEPVPEQAPSEQTTVPQTQAPDAKQDPVQPLLPEEPQTTPSLEPGTQQHVPSETLNPK